MADRAVTMTTSVVPMQLVLHTNDAVDVSYSDGSRLQLSACGTTFVYHQAPSTDSHPLKGCQRLQQRTQFVTSTFKHQVYEALDFRNRFAQQPYICRDLIENTDIIRLHADISEIAWPNQVDKADITVLPNGSIKLTSRDEYASMTLAAHQQYFTAEYLAKVSQRKSSSKSHSLHSRRSKSPISTEVTAQISPTAEAPSHNTSRGTISSQHDKLNTSGSSIPEGHDLSHNSRPSHDSSDSDVHDGKWDYTWISQHHSVQDCPQCWEHPLKLLQSYKLRSQTLKVTIQDRPDCVDSDTKHNKDGSHLNSQSNVQTLNESTHSDGISETQTLSKSFNDDTISANNRGEDCDKMPSIRRLLKKDFSDCVYSGVPPSLPANCTAQHLHKWKSDILSTDDERVAAAAYMHGRIKVICCQGVVYRLIWSSPRAVEIYPGDGSMMRSSGLSGHFFTHFLLQEGKMEERMYSVESPPPYTPGFSYSVAKLITRAARFLHHLCQESLQLLSKEVACCWQESLSAPSHIEYLPTVLLEECTVPGLGRFLAYSNGHVRVVFADRTCLDMQFDFSKRVETCLGHSDPDDKGGKSHVVKRPVSGLDLPEGTCRLLLPTGHYHHVTTSRPEAYGRYVEAAVEWAAWVNSSPSDRYLFYKDTIHDQEKQRSIMGELKKIQCFNYVMENKVYPQFGKSSKSAGSAADNHPEPQSEWEPSLQDLGFHTPRDDHAGPTHQQPHRGQGDMGSFDLTNVQEVLRTTAAALKDLDKFLQANGEVRPVHD